MLTNITSANSALRIVVPEFYPGGFDVDDYAADSMFETVALEMAEDLMSADGKYHAGFVFNPTELTLSLTPTSSAATRFDNWYAAQRAAITIFACNAILSIPALEAKYSFVNGVLYSWPPAPVGQRILGARQAVFHFESVTRSAL